MAHEPGPDSEGLRKILENLPDFVLMVDRDGLIRYINRVEPGFRREEVVGSPAEDMLLPDSRQPFREAFEAVLSGGEPVKYEVEVMLPDGTRAWYQSQTSAYRDGEEITGVVLVAQNITELRLAQESAAALRTLLPICSWCDRIRSEAGQWESVEDYVARKEAATISHGLCEDCFDRQMQGLDEPGPAGKRRA